MKPNVSGMISDVLSTMGVSSEGKPIPDTGGSAGWKIYMFLRSDGTEPPVPHAFTSPSPDFMPTPIRRV